MAGSDLRALVRGVAALFLSVGLLNASNYAFHVVATRILAPSEYGGLSGLLAMLLVLSVPCGVLQTVVAKRTAMLRADGGEGLDALTARTTRGLALLGGAIAAVVVIASPLVGAFVHVGLVPALLLAPFAFFAIVASAPLGVLQGQKRFAALGWATSSGVVVRFVVGVALMSAGWGIVGALLGSAVAQVAVLGISLRLLRLPGHVWATAGASIQWVRGELASTLAALTGFWLLVETDIVLARHYFGAHDSGVYAAAGILARAVLFLPAAVALVALPHFAEAGRDVERSRQWLRLSLTATGALAFGAALVLALFGRPLLSLTFGTDYAVGDGLLAILAPAMASLALTSVLLYFHIAAGSRAYRVVYVGLAAETLLIAIGHGSGQEVAIVVLGVGAAVTAVLFHAAHAVLRWRPEAARSIPAPDLERDPDLDLSIVLPCRDAASSLGDVLDRLTTIGGEMAREIIVVSDGSTDDTVQIANVDRPVPIRVLSYEDRIGKGQALRVGLSEARGRYVAFMDADGDVDPTSLGALLAIVDLYEPDIVLGSKRHPLSELRYPPLRRLLSWSYHKLTRVLFRVNVRDTQTGLKLIRRDVLAAVLPRMLEKRFAFDLEMLVVARSLGYTAVFEAPIRIDYRFESHVDVRAASRILLDTLAVFYRRAVLDTYRPEPGWVPVRRRTSRANGHRRILILNWRDIRNPDAGGAEVVTHEVAKRWVQRGEEVTLLTSRFVGAPNVETLDGVRIRRLGRLRAGTLHLRIQWELATLRGYDVVIDEINTIPFFTPLWRHRLPPTVGLIHQLAEDVWDAEVPRPVAPAGRWLERRMLGLYRDVPMFTVSQSTKRDLEEIGLRHVHVIPQGRDEPPVLTFEKAAEPTFLYVGRLTANKRPEDAVEAFRQIREELPTARLWIVGRGPLVAKLQKRLPDGTEMLGFLPREELYRRMAQAHCLLVTSVREGWGLVITEANAVGTPAVGYDVAGVRDSIVNGRTGLLTSASDPAALARACVSLLSDPPRYSVIQKQAMEWASRLSWDETASEFLKLVEAASVARPRRELAGGPVIVGGQGGLPH
jgi:glycosyltransferase involved in cell wall biosynthesis/O-antigen/teichoic acid export membrane protein